MTACVHHWLIPAAAGKREDGATCKLCGATKMMAISWPYDWPDARRKRLEAAMMAPIAVPRQSTWVRAKEKGER